jgi:hypothetical protein
VIGSLITGAIAWRIDSAKRRKHEQEIRRARGETIKGLFDLRNEYRSEEDAWREALPAYRELLDTLPAELDEVRRLRNELSAALSKAVQKYTDIVEYEYEIFRAEPERIKVEAYVEDFRLWLRVVGVINREDVTSALNAHPLKFNHRDLIAFRHVINLLPEGTEGREQLSQEVTALIEA